MPPDNTFRVFHEESDLFIYCGHGAGEKLCDSHRLRKLKCPAAMLWGCSSGRLPTLGIHDPSGPAQSYLLGGAAFVLANLWDVTDKDIDKLSITCMRAVLGDAVVVAAEAAAGGQGQGKGKEAIVEEEEEEAEAKGGGGGSSSISVSGALASSRDICKLKNAVGCAPVMYGLPISFTK